MTWTRALPAALAVCVLLLTGTASCDSGDAGQKQRAVSPSPVGKVLKDTDEQGRHYREVDGKDAPDVGIEVQPDTDDSWDVRLTVTRFRFSPPGAGAAPVEGRGLAYLYVDGGLVTRLRTPEYRIPGDLVPRGTHTVTVRLYADDGTVWAVDGDPVESAADITVSGAEASPDAEISPGAVASPGSVTAQGSAASPGSVTAQGSAASPHFAASPHASASTDVAAVAAAADASASPSGPAVLSAPGTYVRTGGRGSPDCAGKAS
ncbi:hypothetical protein [Streptomyces sp. Act143]|uniref:hypothetical protein n=1 Tax=Streptomyces sp. Act143 TaxID=2200760 RepID=UPI0026B2EB39